MVNFYIKLDASHNVQVDPALDLLEIGGVFDASAVNVLFEINLTESQARIFQFKLANSATDDISGADVKFRYKHIGNTFKNWPVFLNHWHNWYDKRLLDNNYRTDQTIANTLAKGILDVDSEYSITYNSLFANPDVILAQIGRALNDALKSIRQKLTSAASTLGVNGSDNGVSDGLSPYTDTSGNSIPEYIFQKLFLDEYDNDSKDRFLKDNLSNPSLLGISASDTSCFTVDGSYNEWIDIPIHNGDAFFIDYQATIYTDNLSINNINTDDIAEKNTQHNGAKSVVKINIVKDTTSFTKKTKNDFSDSSNNLHTPSFNYNNITNNQYIYDESDANTYVGPHKDSNDNYPLFHTSFAAAHYTDGTNNSTDTISLTVNGNTVYKNAATSYIDTQNEKDDAVVLSPTPQ